MTPDLLPSPSAAISADDTTSVEEASPRRWRSWARLGGIALAYGMMGWLGLSLAFLGDQITLLWAPIGIALSAMVIWGTGWAPLGGVFLGALLLNLWAGGGWSALAIAAGNALGPWCGARWLRSKGVSPRLERHVDVGWFLLLGVVLSACITSVNGTLWLTLAGGVEGSGGGVAWLVWFAADAAGVLVFAPVLMVVAGAKFEPARSRARPLWRGHTSLELVLSLSGVGVMSGVLFFVPALANTGLLFLPFPFLMWAAIRTEDGGVFGAMITCSAALVSASLGWGPFWRGSFGANFLTLWCFVGATSIPALLIAAHFHDQQRITRSLGEERAQLAFLAHHDSLTRLPNRHRLRLRLDDLLQRRPPQAFSVLFIDLDGFKDVNDALGHLAGDRVLIEVAGRLRECLQSPRDMLARLGGDEFVMVVVGDPKRREPERMAAELISVFAEPFLKDVKPVLLSASIGISWAPEHGSETRTLLRRADTAMYRAKAGGRNRAEVYTRSVDTTQQMRRLELRQELRQALEQGELRLHYQPLVELRSGEIVGVEALLRWQHPKRGLVSAWGLIVTAEETGQIQALGQWVLEAACKQLSEWRAVGLERLTMSINVSPMQFLYSDLHGQLAVLLETYSLPSQLLCLEITESAALHEPERCFETLAALRELGVSVSIDDFGTGYSSLAQLKRLPIDNLKIDRAFVRDLPHDREDEAITRAILALGRELGLRVIAEGVEDDEQRMWLLGEGCQFAQGYFFARPLSPEALVARVLGG